MDHDDQARGSEERAAGSHESPWLQGLFEENNREEIRIKERYLHSPGKFIFEALQSHQPPSGVYGSGSVCTPLYPTERTAPRNRNLNTNTSTGRSHPPHRPRRQRPHNRPHWFRQDRSRTTSTDR